jgi:hypothetical protein
MPEHVDIARASGVTAKDTFMGCVLSTGEDCGAF